MWRSSRPGGKALWRWCRATRLYRSPVQVLLPDLGEAID
jgi:hypothetical protein